MAKSLKQTKPLTSYSILMAKLTLLSTALYVLLFLSLHLIKPDIDPTWQFLSEYALGDFGWIMVLTFFMLAISLLSLFFAIRTQVKTVVGYIGLALLLLSAIGVIISGVFPTDPTTLPKEQITFNGIMHSLGASLDWTPFAALLIGLSLIRSKGWSTKKKPILIAAIITMVLTFAFIGTAASVPKGEFGPGTYAGLIGRFLFLSYAGWITVVAIHATTINKYINN